MDIKSYCKFAPLLPSHPALPEILKDAIGNPTPEKIQDVLKMYQSPDHFMVGYFIDLKLTALIGLLKKDQQLGILKHIAVAPDQRLHGIGRGLIQDVLRRYSLTRLQADTDQETVSFYRKCGFSCKPVSDPYNNRFQCLLQK